MADIEVICLGEAGRPCHESLEGLITDERTRLILIGDEEVEQTRETLRALPNGGQISGSSVCVIVNADGSVEGAVGANHNLEAFTIFTEALAKRDGV